MSGHATAESLSLYLDAALSRAQRRAVESHLEACPECRQRLDGLRRVVAGLGRLESAAPPEDMAARVAREIDLRGRRGPWRRMLDGAVPAPLVGSPPIHLLALVLALGAIVYMFAIGLELHRERPTRIVPVSAENVVVDAPPAAEPVAANGRESLYLLGGRFRRTGGVWVEEGLAERAPDARLRLDAGDMPPAPMPEISELAQLDAPLRMRVGEEVVEIAFESATPLGE